MGKEQTKIEAHGKIIGIEKTQYVIELDTGKVIKGYTSGKMKKHSINLTLSDEVICELDAYSMDLCRIIKRL